MVVTHFEKGAASRCRQLLMVTNKIITKKFLLSIKYDMVHAYQMTPTIALKRVGWFPYSLIVGLAPVGIKVFICCHINGIPWTSALTQLDFVWSGFILQIACAHELLTTDVPQETQSSGRVTWIIISVIQILLFVVLYTEISVGSLYKGFLSEEVAWRSCWVLWASSLLSTAVVRGMLKKQHGG